MSLHTRLPHDKTTIEVRLPSDILPTVQSKPKANVK